MPAVTGPADGALFTAGESFRYAGSAADAEDGALPAARLSWRVDYFTGGAPARPLVPETAGVTAVEFTIPTVTPYTLPDVLYRVTLTATDSAGHRAVGTRDLLPRTARVTVVSRPAGVALTVGGQPVAGSTTFTGVAGVERQHAAPATTTVNGLTLTFAGWSGGPRRSPRGDRRPRRHRHRRRAGFAGAGDALPRGRPDPTPGVRGRLRRRRLRRLSRPTRPQATPGETLHQHRPDSGSRARQSGR